MIKQSQKNERTQPNERTNEQTNERTLRPGKFVLEGGDDAAADDADAAAAADDDDDDDDAVDATSFKADGANSRGGVNSGARLGPDGLGTDLPPALQPTLASREAAAAAANANDTPLCEEAYRFSCAADWLLADAKRCDTTLEALDDCTFVMATTARPRGNMPLVTARVAAEMLAKEAKRGKVAILFGNERTGLTNDELAQAHAAVRGTEGTTGEGRRRGEKAYMGAKLPRRCMTYVTRGVFVFFFPTGRRMSLGFSTRN